MKERLVLLADELDKLGFHKEAEALDAIISRIAKEVGPEKKS